MDYAALPGGDLVRQGLDDLEQGVESVPSLLVSIGAPRLRRAGVPVPERTFDDPEHRLYLRLAAGGLRRRPLPLQRLDRPPGQLRERARMRELATPEAIERLRGIRHHVST